ncbi:MAG TPA: PSD1 and planctomycete cytochrome C domain-containing protein [Tepidisphaeraceae bacterium]|nr:PSD1 and planctomycete cytochrome C domain-containing protein [Tepidisphaeraceae bacterium]
MRRVLLAGATVLAWALCGAARAAEAPPPTKEGLDFFEQKIRPVLVQHCYECHSQVKRKIKGKLRLDSYASMLKGGESGKPSVVPGDPDKSLIVFVMTYTDKDTDTHDALLMPPPKNGKPRKLPDSVINDFRQWIKMGAPYPQGASAHSKAPEPQAAKEHWAFVPPVEPAVPQVKASSWVKNPIDAFVLAKLEEHNLHPSNPADKRTLIRRATFDLIGLPPTQAEVDAFEADNSSDAFEKVVDRLLASPRYGERWGRYWLDVARYADTKGYVFEEERRYPYSYTYRDWVIGAFNKDLPYNQFLIDQIAADKLDLKGDNSALAAEGFLTLGRRFLNNLPDIIDDRIDVVCRGTMALTVGCARCHDHKFDPISQKDYYSLYSVFNNSPEATNLPLIGKPEGTPEYDQFQKELARREAEATKYRETKLAEHLAALRSPEIIAHCLLAAQFRGTPQEQQYLKAPGVTPWIMARWRNFLDEKAAAKDPVFVAWRAYTAISQADFATKSAAVTQEIASKDGVNPLIAAAFKESAPASIREVALRYGKVLASANNDKPFADADREALRQILRSDASPTSVRMEEIAHVLTVPEGQFARRLVRETEAYKATAPGAPPRAMVLQDAAGDAPQHVFIRGNPGNPGPLVKPAFLSVLSGKAFTQGSGRLELARDIASNDNPLTARVIVNRIWLHHFGKAIVRTPSDFGMRSDPPTHPKLLDYLAVQFMKNGWSIKKLHKMILLSATYQQSSEEDPAVAKADPDNLLLSHYNRQRLDWEATRDSLLFAAGKLDTDMGGRPVEVLQSNRRTVYGFIDRQNLPGVFRAFDFATPDTTSPQRFTTTVPQQALFLMNSPFIVREAKALVERPEVADQSDAVQRIAQLYRIVYQRSPSPQEIELAMRFVGSDATASKFNAWEQYAQVLLESNEFVFVD